MSDSLSHPVVSVIVPTYNRLNLLRATVDSLRAQTFRACEFLLIDDRSSNDVIAYLKSLSQIDARFRVLFKEGETAPGCQVSRNLGIDRSQGEWLMFLDSDDLLAPHCLGNRLSPISNLSPSDIYVGNQAVFFEASGESKWVNILKPNVPDLDRFLCIAAPIDVPWVNGGCLFRREMLLKNGIRWESGIHWDDVWFHVQCLSAGMSVSWLPRTIEPDSWYRLHGTEHYGNVLHSDEGKLNSAKMIFKLTDLLGQRGQLKKNQALQISRVLFSTCILPFIDAGKWAQVREWIDQAEALELFPSPEWKFLRSFVVMRKVARNFGRVTFFVNRLAKTKILCHAFASNPSTYGTLPTQSPIFLKL